MKNVADKDRLSEDIPKKNPWSDDSLGFADFSKDLSERILNNFSSEGFVMGLSAPWGSGKTTALNFTRRYLDKHNQEVKDPKQIVKIVDFNPWLFSGRVDLIAAFFQVLAETYPEKQSRWKKVCAFLRGNTETLSELLAKVGVLVDPTAGVASGAAIAVGKRSLNKVLEKWLATPSLQATYNTLNERLKKKKQRTLVIIDDLDRLSAEEIRSMMQMVKSVGKLPYVTYLLSYDRKHISAALSEDSDLSHTEPKFEEKIIQHEFSLPHPSWSTLSILLDKNIDFMAKPITNNSRWHTVVEYGIRRWIKTPRDINRYTNALKCIVPVLQNEIDPLDIMAMEGLRLFEPHIFQFVKNKPECFISQMFSYHIDDNAKEEQKEEFSKCVSTYSDIRVIRLLKCLFPNAPKIMFEGPHMNPETYYETARRRGIGDEKFFYTYMAFGLPTDAIPNAVIGMFMSNLKNEDRLYEILVEWSKKRDATGEPIFSEFLTQLEYRMIGVNAIKPTPELLNALVSIGEVVSRLKETPGALLLSSSIKLFLLITQILEFFPENERADKLHAAVQSKRNVAYGIELFSHYGHQLGMFGDSQGSEKSPISNSDWQQLGEMLKPLFEEDLKSGLYLEYPKAWATVRFYAYCYDNDECKKWVSESANKSDIFLLGVVDGLSITSFSTNGTSYEVKEKPNTEIYDLDGLFKIVEGTIKKGIFHGADLEKLQAFVRHMSTKLRFRELRDELICKKS